MGRLAVCPYCSNQVATNEPTKKYKSKTYHTQCYKKMCDELFAKEKEKQRNQSTGEDAQLQLYNYICLLFNIKELTPFLNAQLQKMFRENKFTYDGVLFTLKYFFEIKGNPVDIKYGIGIVPIMYEEAKQFYIKREGLIEKSAKLNLDKKVETVKVSSQKRKNKFLIDINKL